MNRVQIIEHNGKKIVYIDFSGCSGNEEEVFTTMEEAKGVIKQNPLNSVLTLTNIEGTKFNTKILNAMKEYTGHNKPYVKAGALIGMGGLQAFAYNVVTAFSKRNIPTFNKKEEALEWLVKQ